ncbi:hypothetical protein M5K25_011976 [Dendrobium thyrsiflorum]|uniref:Uncharacterized protein n=1 Tax=Dendrobium thyrsiflorum TaxID=117978 RepID=A0ABD0VBH4_DENTH
MHGGKGEERKSTQHMRPVLTNVAAAAEANKPAPVLLPTTPKLFLKDGRKIQVGDCALFQAGNAPPFIGIIRRFSTDKEDCLKLCVNWLYRQADIKLTNGLLLEAAPNEVFYSTHKDIIAVTSVLHPCKVAFLGKGVQLPSGISSFVCRRFYDIENKCLWWLTDRGYIKRRREELDQLLDKTRLEMNATVQSGGRSPKHLNSPISAQHLMPTPPTLQNNGTTFSSQIKGKKRGRGDNGMESIKREHILKADDGDSAVCKFDNIMIKAEISKITEKGALITTDGVEKLVQLMQIDNNGKVDLACRVLLADVIAATDTIDCLNKFVQIRGLPIFDEWLQEAHKGNVGDGSCPKETDKSVEELVLSLLRALNKLPVNLNALQTCNIGKSVNHLRGSKNLEIQKKARSLVDTWKKRVDAEMKTIDAKTVGSSQAVTWPVKPGFTEITHAGSRRTGSTGLTMNRLITQQSACKALPGKFVPADDVVRPATLIAGSPKLQSPPSVTSSKAIGVTGALDLPHVVAKEEKSSNSSQSQSNSQSCSSDHGKTISPSLKEDARSSTARSVNASKTFVGSSHPQKSSNGHVARSCSGGQKDSSKPGSVSRTSVVDKVSQSALSCARIINMPASEHGSSHRLIVRLPNTNHSPLRSISGSSLEEPSTGSRASSPGVSDKHDHGDPEGKTRNDSVNNNISANLNAESWQSNDVKVGLVGYDEGDGSATVVPKEEVRAAVETGSASEISRTACSSSVNERGTGFTDPKRNSFSSMNALAESCAKYCEASSPLPDGDDVGMDLLASVATGEMLKSDLVSPAASQGSYPVKEDHFAGSNEPKVRFSSGGAGCQILSPSAENTDFHSHKDGNKSGSVFVKDQIQKVFPKFTCNDQKVVLLLEGFKEVRNRDDVVQDEDAQGVDGKVSDDFTGKSERSPVGETKSCGHGCEKIAEGSMHASDSDNKLLFHCVGGSSVQQPPSDKLEHRPPTLTGQQLSSIVEVTTKDVEDECQDASDRNASAEEHTGFTSSSLVMANGTETIEREGSLESCVAGSVGNYELSTISREAEAPARKEELVSVSKATSYVAAAEQDAGAKLDFDLNEGLPGEDINQSEPATTVAPGSTAIRMPSLPPCISSLVLSNSPCPITVAAPAKGPFLPPENLLKCKGEPGWKGSAATSAFRPAEPRKVLDMLLTTDMQLSDSATTKKGDPHLDIDLNVPSERVLDDLASENFPETTESESGIIISTPAARAFGELDLDLNRVEENMENGHCSASSSRRLEVSLLPKRSVSETLANGEMNMSRDFDLNNGPVLIEVGAEPVLRKQMLKSSGNVSFVPSITALRMNHTNAGNGWFPAGNSYPAIAAPFLPDRGGSSYPIVASAGAQTILRPVIGSVAYGSDVYRAPVLSSSSTMAFSPGATSLPYVGFPFSSSFPLASTCFTAGPTTYVDSSAGGASYFPPIFSQLVGQVGAMPYSYPRPHVISLPDVNACGGTETSSKWGRQVLDLNTGPGSTEELKDDRMRFSSSQISVTSSHTLMEDQARLHQLGIGSLKRKVPGAWETERFNYSQSSWQ